MKKFLTILLSTMLVLTAQAQEETLSKLQNDIFSLEETISELTGKQEELQYQLQQLQKQLNENPQTTSPENTSPNQDVLNQLQNLTQRLEALENNEITATETIETPVETEVAEVTPQQTDLSEEEIKNIYEEAFLQLTRKQYPVAEESFKNFLNNHPSHRLAANASYWLAETYYVRKDYKAAATQFLQAYNNYPESSKRFDALLKLSLSLRALNAPEDACKTLAELLNPANDPVGLLSASTKRRAEKEQEELRC